MSETPMQIAAAPALGEATADVLTAEAGYETADLTVMSDRGVI
jgi:hypothetical protein